MPDKIGDKQPLLLDYPSNNPRSKSGEVRASDPSRDRGRTQGEHLTPVAQGSKRKRSLGKRASDAFLGEDTRNVGEYMLWGVFIPAAKRTIADLVSGGIEMLMFGTTEGRKRSSRDYRQSTSIFNYGDQYERRDLPEKKSRDVRYRSRSDFDDIVFSTRSQAEDVLNELVEQIDIYGSATVADLYDLAGITEEWTDQNWGWDNLSKARPVQIREGWILDLPRPILLR